MTRKSLVASSQALPERYTTGMSIGFSSMSVDIDREVQELRALLKMANARPIQSPARHETAVFTIMAKTRRKTWLIIKPYYVCRAEVFTVDATL